MSVLPRNVLAMETEAVIKGSRAREGRPYKELTTARTILVAVGAAAIGLIMLYVSGLDIFSDGIKALLNNLGSALIVSVALAVIWDLWGRRAFSREILETARTTAEVEASGLTHVGTNYVEDPDWENLFRDVRKLDIFVAYGRTWRNAQLSRLKAVAARPDARIRVYLPDPDDLETIEHLADRFSMASSDLISAIKEAKRDFEALKVYRGAVVEIYYRKGDVVFSCYRFDKTAIFILYSHARKRAQVPTFVCRDGGSLYQFVRDEFKGIHDQSTLVT